MTPTMQAIIDAEVAERDAEIARLRAELSLWKPMTPAEAQAAYDKAEAMPLSEEEIQRIIAKVTDPAERLNNEEEAQLHVVVARLRATVAKLLVACKDTEIFLRRLGGEHHWAGYRGFVEAIAEAERT